MAAIANGGTVVLANKEPLVSAGEVVLAAAAKAGRRCSRPTASITPSINVSTSRGPSGCAGSS